MRCPVCRAENAEDPTCRRCKADLTLLVTLEQTRQSEIADAMQAALSGDGARALSHAEAAHQLRPDSETWRWLAVACLLKGDFARALACRQQV